MLLTTDPPDLSVYQRDNIAEIRPWLNAVERDNDAASRQLPSLPPSKWLRQLWTTTEQRGYEQSWLVLPDEIIEIWIRGEDLAPGDFAFLLRVASGGDSVAAIAATRTLGLLVDAQPELGDRILGVLERGLRHSEPEVRAASAEAIWIANGTTSADRIREAAGRESIASVRDYMLHAARLLTPG